MSLRQQIEAESLWDDFHRSREGNGVNSIALEYAGKRCLLNGKPAVISGRKNQFATVSHVKGPLSIQWSWDAVKHVMESGGQFKA